MNILSQSKSAAACGACREGAELPFSFSMAFQPIVDLSTRRVYAFEALVRGSDGAGAYSVLSQVTEENRYTFDQQCRIKAISLAAQLGVAGLGAKLSVNFMPGAVYSPAACIQKTLQTARATGFPLDSLIFEITEDERVRDTAHLQGIASEYQRHGFQMALDDFGAGYSGLHLLAELDVDLIKLDMSLVRDLHQRSRSAEIIRSTVKLCHALDVAVLAEGVECGAEAEALQEMGVSLMQGYFFAKPGFETLPEVLWPEHAHTTNQQPRSLLEDLPGTSLTN